MQNSHGELRMEKSCKESYRNFLFSSSRLVHIRDTRRGVDETVRALAVAHTFQDNGNSTVISYGKDYGWM